MGAVTGPRLLAVNMALRSMIANSNATACV